MEILTLLIYSISTNTRTVSRTGCKGGTVGHFVDCVVERVPPPRNFSVNKCNESNLLVQDASRGGTLKKGLGTRRTVKPIGNETVCLLKFGSLNSKLCVKVLFCVYGELNKTFVTNWFLSFY